LFRCRSSKKITEKGWKVKRQKGSHTMMTKEGYQYTLAIPLHKELGVGLLRKLLQQAKIDIDDFNNL
jgi:predicted RNA binding protein YcfA (HicA-like mRNA interferase family)